MSIFGWIFQSGRSIYIAMKSVRTHMAFIMLTRQKNVTCKIVSIRVHKVKHKEKEKEVENLNIQRIKGIAFVLFLFAKCCIIEGKSMFKI